MTLPDGSILTFILMFVLIVISAFLAACETAYTSFNRTKMKNLAAEGNKRATKALKLAESYDKVLSTILVGNNIVNILFSVLSTILCVTLLNKLSITNVEGIAPVISTIFSTVP